LLIFRARERRAGELPPTAGVRVPGHPFTTLVFVLACLGLSVNTIIHFPQNAGIGVGFLLFGVVVYRLWRMGA
jgi:APA family basic amino acid/polyamine antiporter